MGKVTYPLRLEDWRYEKLVSLARKRGMTIIELLRRAIDKEISTDIK